MTTNQSSGQKSQAPAAKKKTYQKPAFRYESVFETTALSCGKVGPTQSSCRHNRKTS